MEFTGTLDFWFQELPIVQRVEKFSALGIHRLDVWLWREVVSLLGRVISGKRCMPICWMRWCG